MRINGIVMSDAQAPDVELLDVRRRLVEVTVPDPGRPGAQVNQARPVLAVASVGKPAEVKRFQSLQIVAGGFVRDPFVLNGALVARREPAEDERDSLVSPQVLRF